MHPIGRFVYPQRPSAARGTGWQPAPRLFPPPNPAVDDRCEKPLAHSVYEARIVQEKYLQTRDKLATQMGTQIHAGANYRRVVELVQSGAIGPVREAHAWCGRIGPGGELPQGEEPVPEHLHWDLWLGPAPFRPYNSKYMPGNLTWNRYWDFGNGTLGDMGSHVIDLAFWALKLRDPLRSRDRTT